MAASNVRKHQQRTRDLERQRKLAASLKPAAAATAPTSAPSFKFQSSKPAASVITRNLIVPPDIDIEL
jgi:hypothetical protein